jgi:transcription initiation factor IIE alpha subunit
MLVLLLLAVYSGTKAIPEYHTFQQTEQDRYVAKFVSERGEVSFAELAREASLPAGDIPTLLDRLINNGQLDGKVDKDSQRIFSTVILKDKQAQLLNMVQAYGEITLRRLAQELNVSAQFIRQMVYKLVGENRFTGYLNWQEGTLFSQDAKKMLEKDTCPHCGGSLTLAGQGIVQCQNCGTEVFL